MKAPATAQITEKKSRFIGQVFPAATQEEASDIISDVRKKYWDARHNVSAFIVGDDMPIERSSDDGEPAGTAGRPVLEVLRGANVRGAVMVVTRYFGGILLGTGGLVRAYTQSAKAALEAAELVAVMPSVVLGLTLDYASYGRLKSYLAESGLEERKADFGQDVRLELVTPEISKDDLIKSVIDMSDGKASCRELEQGMFEIDTDLKI